MNILFVCSRNSWRSPTAEEIYKNKQGLNVRSAGTEPSARIKLNSRLIEWADLILLWKNDTNNAWLKIFLKRLLSKK